MTELPPSPDENAHQSPDELSIAQDYRRQLQSRYRNEFAMSPGEIPSSVIADMLKNSFNCVDPDTIAEHERNSRNWESGIKVTSPLDKPGTHGLVQERCKEVEDVLRELDIPFGDVAYGSVPTGENVFECSHVQATEASVIALSEGFLSFCLVISKVFALSLLYGTDGNGTFVEFEHDKVISKIRADVELQEKWLEIFSAYARGVGPAEVKHRYISPPAAGTAYQLLFAMERFVVAHEYAHHVMNHGRSDQVEVRNAGVSPKDGDLPPGHIEEFHADLLALSVGSRIRSSKNSPDIFGVSGGAAVLVLKSLECVKRTKSVLTRGGGEIVASDTHPSTAHRLVGFDIAYENLPAEEKERYKAIRDNFAAIIDSIWELLLPAFVEMHRSGVRPLASDDGGWLPR